MLAAVSQPGGIVLVTGPTGSGKTTTLYALIDHIRTGREKIVTVEDPIEYELAGVPQVPVNERFGVSFASALRALLRQDPDVLLVGEIRDEETAQIATQAALTGHLVLSTLHTTDAAGALTRMMDLGIAPYLVASTVSVVLAQRLVRRVCRDCGSPLTAPAPSARAAAPASSAAATATGCEACRFSGYRGRVGLYELLRMDDTIREAVVRRESAAQLRAMAIRRGMRTLEDDGRRLVEARITTMAEVRRVTVTAV